MELKPGYKQTGLGVLPEDWNIEPLGELSDFVTSGSRGWAQFYSESGALFIRSQNVRDGHLSFDDLQYVSPPTGAEGNRTRVERNDLLITITGNSVGNVALVDQAFDEAYVSQHVGLVRLREPLRGAYISRYLSPNAPGNPQIAGSQSGQSKPGLTLQNLRDFRIALPPTLRELDAIAEALRDVDVLLGGLNRLITKKRDLKHAAMQQLLTGQTRLPFFHGEWKVMKVGELCDYVDGIATLGGDLGYLEIGDVNVETKTYDVAQKEKLSVRGAVKVPAGTLLISTVRPTRGAIVITDSALYVSSAFCRVRPVNGLLFHLVCQPRFLAYLGENSIGGTYPTCRDETVLDYESELPSDPAEQAAIAEVLTEMDAELAALEQRREKTRCLKQGMMQALLTGRTRLV